MIRTSELKNKTAKGLFWGGMSNGVQQLLNLFFGIFLARLLSPGDYGMVGMLAIFSVIAGSLQDSGFSSALINRNDGDDKEVVWSSVFWFNIVVSAIIYIILFFSAPLIADFFRTPQLVKLARFVFLGFFFSSFGCTQNAYFMKHLLIKKKSMAIITAQLISGITGVILANRGYAYWGLAVQSVLYILTVQILYWILSPWHPSFKFSITPIREMFPFSCKLLVTNVFTNVNNNIFSVLLGRFYTKKEVGDYTQANKWNAMSYGIISGMVSGVSQPVLASVNDDRERQLRILRKMVRFTAFLSFPAMFGLALIAPEFITIAITDKWAESSMILRILCIGGAFIPISQLFGTLLISKGKSDIFMLSTITFSLLQIAILLALRCFGILAMVGAYAVLNIVWVGVWHLFVKRQTGYTFWNMMKDILPFLGISGIVMVLTLLITNQIQSIYLTFVCKIALAASFYFLIMRLLKAKVLKESLDYLLKRR